MEEKYLLAHDNGENIRFYPKSLVDMYSDMPIDVKEVSKDIRDRYYNQPQGIKFKLKNINGATFEEIFEEISSEQPPHMPTLEEQNRADIDYLSIMLGVEL